MRLWLHREPVGKLLKPQERCFPILDRDRIGQPGCGESRVAKLSDWAVSGVE
jgi:hypothetical protein